MMYGYGFPWIGGIVMMLFWVVILGVCIWGVVIFARNAGRSNSGTPGSETPLDVVKRRYAAGEIDKEQFEEMKRNLGA